MASFSYPKSFRLRTRFEYSACRDARTKLFFHTCVVYWKKNKVGHARLGCSIKKQRGSACERNLFRRRVREAFRLLPLSRIAPFDIHVVPQGFVRDISWKNIQDLLVYVFSSIEKHTPFVLVSENSFSSQTD